MNKYQEALDEFWEAYVTLIGMNKKTIILKNGDYEHDFIKYKKSLQELVDEATPKKVKNWLADKSMACCPICNMPDYAEEKTNYCRYCGQALDWSKDDNPHR